MPSLTHLEVSHAPGMGAGILQEPLRQMLPDMPHLKTLLLPNSSYHGLFPSALFESQRLEQVQVSYEFMDAGQI
jgi:hypothetical protein